MFPGEGSDNTVGNAWFCREVKASDRGGNLNAWAYLTAPNTVFFCDKDTGSKIGVGFFTDMWMGGTIRSIRCYRLK